MRSSLESVDFEILRHNQQQYLMAVSAKNGDHVENEWVKAVLVEFLLEDVLEIQPPVHNIIHIKI